MSKCKSNHSADAEDLSGGTLNEPANYGSKQASNFCYPQEQLDFFFSVHFFIIFVNLYFTYCTRTFRFSF